MKGAGRKENNRVTVAQAAKELGLAPETVRCWMEIGKLDIGVYVRRNGTKRGSYLILRERLDGVLGKGKQE